MAIDSIDAHHHLWKYRAQEYPWMTDNMGALQRDFLLEDLQSILAESEIAGTVVVQARQTMIETEWLLELVSDCNLIRGVVGWVPLIDPNVRRTLEQFAGQSKLKGVRHVLHDEVDDFYMLRDDFNRGIASLEEFRLRYDILIFERHLPQTIEFVSRHPDQIFVVDHIAKPRIKSQELTPWQENIFELARRENVYCKLSGMVNEADWTSWTQVDLQPYLNVILESFGPHRIMFGSDWPVILLASSYQRWVDTVRNMIFSLTPDEQTKIMGATAIEAYRLD